MIRKKEYTKAGEMLWGAIAELLKTIGIMYGKPVKNHKELIGIAKEISLENEELRKAIIHYAQGLHANYYEEFIDIDVFPEYWRESLKAYEKLFKIIIEKHGKIENTT